MTRHRATIGILAAFVVFAAGASAQQGRSERRGDRFGFFDRGNDFNVTILVSNEEGEAPLVDPLLKNAWGIAASSTSPWWVADNGTGTSTLYSGAGAKIPLEVTVPGAPTGIVFNTSATFALAAGTPARFLFASEDGTFSAWNPDVNPNALVVSSDPGSIYKGLAIHGDTLYSTDFGSCEVEAFRGNFFDDGFEEFETAGGFEDESIPKGYCPFGIQAVGDSIFVTYAKKEGVDDVAGVGHGFVREFDADGRLVARVASRGRLNSPWGVAPAPDGFGRFGGCLLVGNFGDGEINAFCRKHDKGRRGHDDGDDDKRRPRWHHAGRLRSDHRVIAIDGLWGIGFGNGATSGPTNVLYFAAGPDDEENGYFGRIEVDEK
jgi:uncharacterized protein (TIGR03118 family)